MKPLISISAKTAYFCLVVTILLLQGACHQSTSAVGDTKSFSVSDFSRLNLELVGDVYYEQSPNSYMEASGDPDLIGRLQVSSKGQMLSIGMDDPRQLTFNKKDLTIKIGSPQLSSIDNNSVGTFYIEKTLKGNMLAINNTGVGQIKITDCQVSDFTLDTKAVGAVEIRGSAQRTVIQSDGVGKIDCSGFRSVNTKVTSNGVGDLSVYAKNSLELAIFGMGNIKYFGNPSVVKSDIKGLGKVINMDK